MPGAKASCLIWPCRTPCASAGRMAGPSSAAAFEAEPTNAQLLWDRAHNLNQAGQVTEAQKLYRRLAESPWQLRFRWLQDHARWQLENR